MPSPADSSPTPPLRVVISLDVEGECLFGGSYAATGSGATKVGLLPKLAPLSDHPGFPPTLFCAGTVFASAAACAVPEEMRDRHGAEIGGHLHHWSTPPCLPQPDARVPAGGPVRTHLLPRDLLRERLWHGLAARRPRLPDPFHFFGALSANPFWPFWHGPKAMRLATRPHVRRAGNVPGLFWHSSEMLPAASAHVPDEAAPRGALDKIFSFCRRPREHFSVKGVTLTEVRTLAPELGFPWRGAFFPVGGAAGSD